MQSFLVINGHTNGPVMWDTGASFNFMLSLEANLLGLSPNHSLIASVVVYNEDLLKVKEIVNCSVQFKSNDLVSMNFHIVSKLSHRMIVGQKGIELLLLQATK
jgi:hypothetical protein